MNLGSERGHRTEPQIIIVVQIRVILGLYRHNGKENGSYYSILRLYRDNGKENGSYYSILGLYRDNGKENGNYYSILGLYRDNGTENGSYYLGFRVLGFGFIVPLK